jgi:hypothetical protein
MTEEQLHADVVAEPFWEPEGPQRAGCRIPGSLLRHPRR